MDINTMINQQLKVTMASRGAFLVFTLLSALALSGCGDKDEREFIRGCKYGGGTGALCGCIWDDLKTKYTHGELERISQQYGYVPPKFMDNMLSATQQCKK